VGPFSSEAHSGSTHFIVLSKSCHSPFPPKGLNSLGAGPWVVRQGRVLPKIGRVNVDIFDWV